MNFNFIVYVKKETGNKIQSLSLKRSILIENEVH